MKKIRNAHFQVRSTGGSSFDPDVSADVDGNMRVDGLVLVDRKTGKDWEISIRDGEIVIEPLDKDEKRDFRIKKILTDGSK